ncbi:high choriolytic enzyme 1-like [Fundulus heteroclitus]|uniref:high choriolytic enzyme 1-like n=1 Tax=Fundulus heteroclitus TaxID=8078 RepID=UPI00165CC0CE|nr:high choriolytic enzyme 1-like [Fundulus heteroclitus]
MVLDWIQVDYPVMVVGQSLSQTEGFKCLVLFMSDGRMERAIDRRIGASPAVMRALIQSMVITFIMVPAFLFLLFLSGTSVLLSAPLDNDNKSETLMLLDDIVIPDIRTRNADPCTARGCKWPKYGHFVLVPYEISSDYSVKERNQIIDGLQSFNKSTCIRFVQRTSSHRDYIHFFLGDGCWSYLGRQKGGQKISLTNKGCLHLGKIQHEILHALGFNHEQSRSDRDKYVKILFDNIKPGKRGNFEKKKTNNLGTTYDFDSVMEYANKAFSKNGKPTIVAKSDPNLVFGQRIQMDDNDINRVNKLYECC